MLSIIHISRMYSGLFIQIQSQISGPFRARNAYVRACHSALIRGGRLSQFLTSGALPCLTSTARPIWSYRLRT